MVIIGITIDENREDVVGYMDTHNANWIQILDIVDNGELLTRLYSINLYPTYYFIDKDGYVVLSGINVVDWLAKEGLQAKRGWVGRLLFDFFHLG